MGGEAAREVGPLATRPATPRRDVDPSGDVEAAAGTSRATRSASFVWSGERPAAAAAWARSDGAEARWGCVPPPGFPPGPCGFAGISFSSSPHRRIARARIRIAVFSSVSSLRARCRRAGARRGRVGQSWPRARRPRGCRSVRPGSTGVMPRFALRLGRASSAGASDAGPALRPRCGRPRGPPWRRGRGAPRAAPPGRPWPRRARRCGGGPGPAVRRTACRVGSRTSRASTWSGCAAC